MDILNEIVNNVGIITLNRPKKLNSLSYEIFESIDETIENWKKDERVKLLMLEGRGDKAFCAGGDVLELYSDYLTKDNININAKMEFFTKEFNTDINVIQRQKPLITHWKGSTMGGGVGLSIDADVILADDTLKWAMPETRLGIVPDVGVGFYFSKMEKPLALHLSLTGRQITGADVVKLGLATHYIDGDNYEEIRKKILEANFENLDYKEVVTCLENIIEPYKKELHKTDLDREMEDIRKYYDKDSLEEIIEAMENSSSEFAKRELKLLRAFNPASLVAQFDKYELGKNWTQTETFSKDWLVFKEMVKLGNAQEGIRTTMIDKDDAPKWNPPTIEEVNRDELIRIMKEEEVVLYNQ